MYHFPPCGWPHSVAMAKSPARRRVALIGAFGIQGRRLLQFLPQIADVVGVVDPLVQGGENLADCPHYVSVNDLLAGPSFDAALVAVPHAAHHYVTTQLLAAGKAVLKEKPLAMNISDAHSLRNISRLHEKPIFTLAQRRFNPIFTEALARLPIIGTPTSLRYRYLHDQSEVTQGWRACRNLALGGVGYDMGYHLLDVIGLVFGRIEIVGADAGYHFELMRTEGLEDWLTADLAFPKHPQLRGKVEIARHHCERMERLEILGTAGSLVVEPDCAVIKDCRGNVRYSHLEHLDKSDIMRRQVEFILDHLDDAAISAADFNSHQQVVQVISAIYAKIDPKQNLSSLATTHHLTAQEAETR